MDHKKLTTRFIGIRDFRQNMSGLMKEMQAKNIHYIITRHGKIVAHAYPPTKEEAKNIGLFTRK